jgi:hypothetical protein
MTGLGIIDADLCMWAGTLTQADIEAANATTGHPVLKAKPGPVESLPSAGWIAALNCLVRENPILAAALIAAGYLTLRKK